MAAPGQGYSISKSVQRPVDTTPYGIGDVVGGLLEFAPMGSSGNHLMLTGAQLLIEDDQLRSTEGAYTLYLFNAAPTSIADNAAFDVAAGDRDAYLGSIVLGTPVDIGSTLFIELTALTLRKQIKMGQTSTLYGYLVTQVAYTPTASRVYRVKLSGVAL